MSTPNAEYVGRPMPSRLERPISLGACAEGRFGSRDQDAKLLRLGNIEGHAARASQRDKDAVVGHGQFIDVQELDALHVVAELEKALIGGEEWALLLKDSPRLVFDVDLSKNCCLAHAQQPLVAPKQMNDSRVWSNRRNARLTVLHARAKRRFLIGKKRLLLIGKKRVVVIENRSHLAEGDHTLLHVLTVHPLRPGPMSRNAYPDYAFAMRRRTDGTTTSVTTPRCRDSHDRIRRDGSLRELGADTKSREPIIRTNRIGRDAELAERLGGRRRASSPLPSHRRAIVTIGSR